LTVPTNCKKNLRLSSDKILAAAIN
jgi:hypothetical protein